MDICKEPCCLIRFRHSLPFPPLCFLCRFANHWTASCTGRDVSNAPCLLYRSPENLAKKWSEAVRKAGGIAELVRGEPLAVLCLPQCHRACSSAAASTFCSCSPDTEHAFNVATTELQVSFRSRQRWEASLGRRSCSTGRQTVKTAIVTGVVAARRPWTIGLMVSCCPERMQV